MRPGSVLLDIAIDQGGIFESSDQVTDHDDPIYIKHGIVHYAVSNMPGAVPRTSTLALTNNTLPFITELANKGFKQVVSDNHALYRGVNTHGGQLTYENVAIDQNRSWTELSTLFN